MFPARRLLDVWLLLLYTLLKRLPVGLFEGVVGLFEGVVRCLSAPVVIAS